MSPLARPRPTASNTKSTQSDRRSGTVARATSAPTAHCPSSPVWESAAWRLVNRPVHQRTASNSESSSSSSKPQGTLIIAMPADQWDSRNARQPASSPVGRPTSSSSASRPRSTATALLLDHTLPLQPEHRNLLRRNQRLARQQPNGQVLPPQRPRRSAVFLSKNSRPSCNVAAGSSLNPESADAEEVDNEHKRLVASNDATGTCCAATFKSIMSIRGSTAASWEV